MAVAVEGGRELRGTVAQWLPALAAVPVVAAVILSVHIAIAVAIEVQVGGQLITRAAGGGTAMPLAGRG